MFIFLCNGFDIVVKNLKPPVPWSFQLQLTLLLCNWLLDGPNFGSGGQLYVILLALYNWSSSTSDEIIFDDR